MHLDHISYVASHDHLIDEVQRIGSRLGAGFMDGGIHPRFGTRNFTLPLQGGRYLEIVCPLDHPAADASPFGKVVSRRAQDGGGLLTWVLSVSNISTFEKRLGRESVDGHRRRPDGSDLHWKQIGVLGTLEDRSFHSLLNGLPTIILQKRQNQLRKLKNLKLQVILSAFANGSAKILNQHSRA